MCVHGRAGAVLAVPDDYASLMSASWFCPLHTRGDADSNHCSPLYSQLPRCRRQSYVSVHLYLRQHPEAPVTLLPILVIAYMRMHLAP